MPGERRSCAGAVRSVCKTEYINTSVFVTENRSYRRELEIAPKRQKKEEEEYIYMSQAYWISHTEADLPGGNMHACMSAETELYKQEF